MARPGEVGPRSSCPQVSSAGQQHPEPHPCARPPPSARSAHALARGVPARAPLPRCARAGPATPRLGGGRGRTGIRSAVRLAGAVQGQLAAAAVAAAAVAAAAASSLSAAGRTGAAGRGRGRQAPPQLLAPAIPPGFRALGS